MAKIVASDTAPKGVQQFSLANVEISKLPYTTDDTEALANAEAHPWLDVEYDEAVELADFRNPFETLDPKDDVLRAEHSVAFDPKQIKKDYPTYGDDSDPVAIEAGLDQTKVVETDSGVALTVAADDAPDTKKPDEVVSGVADTKETKS